MEMVRNKLVSSYSQRQLYTIKTFGTSAMVGDKKMCVHVGCMGCGKTRSLVEGFGLYCAMLKAFGLTGLNFVLLGRTQLLVKKSMCNVLSNLFGDDFKYDGSKVNGIVKDAVLFGQNIFIIGFNDVSSETKFRGISDIMGVLHDEAVFCTKEQFNLIMARLRGCDEIDMPPGYVRNWYIGSTNPDHPKHFILEYINAGILKLIQWYHTDALWEGFKEYFNRQKLLYRGDPSGWDRYINGKWAASDNMVYPMFYYKKHVLQDADIDYSQMKRTFLAVDYGSDHPTGILMISVAWSGEYIISKECKLRRTAVSDIVTKLSEYVNFLSDLGVGCDNIYVDPSAAALKDEMRKRGMNYYEALNNHEAGIGYIRNMYSLDKLFILNTCEDLIGEIFSYVFKPNKSGRDEVVKVGDDLVDAKRYGIYTDSVVRGR